jgi:pimeloyl-ACP methyl ester carboxylesterase
MCIARNGPPVQSARSYGTTSYRTTSYRTEGDDLQSSTGHRVSVPWQRMLLAARDAARTAGAVRTLPVAALTKGTHLGAPRAGIRTTAGGHAPVVVVHGYGATPDCWRPLTRALQADGFDRVYAFSYNPFTGGLPELGQALAVRVTAMMERSGSDTVHLVGHSLGGLLVRLATEWLGLWSQAATVVTIATPHHGCPLAWAAPGRAARWMRSKGWTLPDPVFAEATGPRYLNFYAARDVVLPRRSARLELPEVTNIAVAGAGHIGTPRAQAVLATLPGRLAAAEVAREPSPRVAARSGQRAPIGARSQHLSLSA